MFSEMVLLTIILGSVAALVFIALWVRFRPYLSTLTNIPFVIKIALLACGMSFYLHGSLKTNNIIKIKSPSKIAAKPISSRLETINETDLYVDAWNTIGVWEDSFWCRFENDFVFPFGTNHLKGVEVLAWGEIWSTHRKDTVLAELGEKVAIGRGISQFSCEYFAASETNESKYVYSWYNGLVNRETNSVINGRIELRRSGDILVATNGIERLIPRQLPFEHNGFGQDDEWVAANFTNSNEILSVGYSQWVDEQVGVDLTNGLYKLTVTVPEKPLETTFLTVGDYSVAVTNAGEYVFLLEKGVEYSLSYCGTMENLAYEWDDGGGGERPMSYNATRNLSNYEVQVYSYCDLDNPVYFNSPIDDGEGFILYYPNVTITPSYVIDPIEPLSLFAFVFDNISSANADIKWIANDRVIGTGEIFLLDNLSLYTDIKVEVRYHDCFIEGWVYINRYVRETQINLSCGGIIITEDTYTNAPNEVVSANSTSVDLNINYQLTDGGEFKLECDDANGLEIRDETGNVVSLPLEWDGYYNEDAERVYSVAASDKNATGTKTFTLTYTSYFQEEPIVRQINIDVVKIRVEAKADWPSNKVRHVFGPGENIIVKFFSDSKREVEKIAPFEPGYYTYNIPYNQFVIPLQIKVIAPEWPMRFELEGIMSSGDWLINNMLPLNSGDLGVGIRLKSFLIPDYVSFSHIAVMEDCTNMRGEIGCFEDLRFDHTVQNGALRDVGVESVSNQVGGVDFAAFQLNEIPKERSSCFWDIPIKWGPIGGPYDNLLGFCRQEFHVEIDGTCTIVKGGISVSRRKDEE